MKRILFLLFPFLFYIISFVRAQDKPRPFELPDNITIGLGLGLDHGGIGTNFLVYPEKHFGLFVGGGYALVDFTYNVGMKYRFYSDNAKTIPYIVGMYGYNAAIYVSNAKSYNRLFFGPTVGFGLDFRTIPTHGGYWSVALLIPIRSAEVQDYIDDLKNNHGVEFKNGLYPIAISAGYKFIIE